MMDEKLHHAVNLLIESRPDWQERLGNVNPWLYGDYAEIYVRLGSHRISNGKRYRALDVANVEVYEKYRNQGVLTSLLTFLEAKNIPLFIENVQDDWLWPVLERRGYQRHTNPGYEYPPSYFRLSA